MHPALFNPNVYYRIQSLLTKSFSEFRPVWRQRLQEQSS